MGIHPIFLVLHDSNQKGSFLALRVLGSYKVQLLPLITANAAAIKRSLGSYTREHHYQGTSPTVFEHEETLLIWPELENFSLSMS